MITTEQFNAIQLERVKQAEEIAKLRNALSYYADDKHYEGYCEGYFASDITEDSGYIAREALK